MNKKQMVMRVLMFSSLIVLPELVLAGSEVEKILAPVKLEINEFATFFCAGSWMLGAGWSLFQFFKGNAIPGLLVGIGGPAIVTTIMTAKQFV
jgi:hypothetical protein